MKNENITISQGIILIAIFTVGSSTLMIMGLKAKQDIWIAVILAIIIGLFIVLMYSRIMSYFPNKDIFETLEMILGKIFSKIILLLLTWYAFDLSTLVLRNLTQFIVTVSLTETPMYVLMVSFMFVCAYATKLGIEKLGRWAQIFVPIFFGAIVFIVIIYTFRMEIENLQPIFYNGFRPIWEGALEIIAFSFAEIVIFLLGFPKRNNNKDYYKIFISGFLIGGCILLISITSNILVIGASSLRVYYPVYYALSRLSMGDFLHRVEIVAALLFTTSIFLKISIITIATTKGFSNLFGVREYRFLTFPVTLMIINQSYLSFDNVTDFFEWAHNVFVMYSNIFGIFIPLLIVVVGEIRMRIIRKREGYNE